MGQNVLGQSDCSIFKSTISLEHIDEIAWFDACWYKFMETESWLENIGVGLVKKWLLPLWLEDFKIGSISRRNYGINYIFVC